MSECSHDCSSCKENCSSRDPKSLLAPANANSHVKKVIGVVSGKGGVGKSLVTSLLASSMQKAGFASAILDADVTGPSIPKIFGLTQKAIGDQSGIFPVMSEGNVRIMSVNLLLENDSDPVVWRGPIIGGVVKQFWTDVVWGDVDYMFVDMPPGTGDVALTVFQSLPLDGIVILSSPQELVGMIVEKAVKMAAMMNIPVLGIVENMSYFQCPCCSNRYELFGQSRVAALAAEYGIKATAKIPMDPQLAALCDAGKIEVFPGADWLDQVIEAIKNC